MRLGCTGHQKLTPSTRRNVAAGIADVLSSQTDEVLVGLTSLAEGADQVFAFTVLAAGGQLHAILPSQGYEQSLASIKARDSYTALLAFASQTTIMPFAQPSEDAYLAAGQEVANHCDLLVAVWDGQDADGKGGTGDIVTYARGRGVEVRVVWPSGSARS